jgi:hypothetical protein
MSIGFWEFMDKYKQVSMVELLEAFGFPDVILKISHFLDGILGWKNK